MEDFDGNQRYAVYRNFKVASETVSLLSPSAFILHRIRASLHAAPLPTDIVLLLKVHGFYKVTKTGTHPRPGT